MPLIHRDANLKVYPQKIIADRALQHISVGDMHGNALKLIYILIEEGILELNKGAEDYERLLVIYSTPVDELLKDNLDEFQRIIDNAKVNSEKSLTLIGDELADRGNNDYFTLLVLKKLKTGGLPLEILLSNHSNEFLQDYARRNFTGHNQLASGQAASLVNMNRLIQRELIEDKAVRDIVSTYYLPNVKAISYTLSEQGDITLFSHAPIGLETIQSLAKKYDITYKDDTRKDLIHTIDLLNIKITSLLTDDTLVGHIKDETWDPRSPEEPIDEKAAPLNRLIWNRALGDELITQTSKGSNIHFVHGHVGLEPVKKNKKTELNSHENLDNYFGKFSDYNKTDKFFQIEHFTRHSNDIPPHKLDEKFLLKHEFKVEFGRLLAAFKLKKDELTNKATSDAKYVEVSKAADTLFKAVDDAGKNFFSQDITKKSYNTFRKAIQRALSNAEKKGTFAKHRSTWNELHPIIKWIVGFLALITLIPALIITAKSKDGFFLNWLGKPKTDSEKKLTKFKEGLNQEVFDKMEDSYEKLKTNDKDTESGPSSP